MLDADPFASFSRSKSSPTRTSSRLSAGIVSVTGRSIVLVAMLALTGRDSVSKIPVRRALGSGTVALMGAWWGHAMDWQRASVAAIGAMILLAIGVAVGASSTQTNTRTVTEAAAAPPVRTVTVAGRAPPARILTRTRTVTAAAPAPTTPAATTPASTGANEYAGNGVKQVGTIIVTAPSMLTWTCSGDCSQFDVNSSLTDANNLSIASSGTSGQSAIGPGTFHDVGVISTGSWTFQIIPQ